mgnify:CR=1 FL=1
MEEFQLTARLSEVFHGGERLERELRLTAEEAAWVAEHCPASLTDLGEGWYHMEFQEVYC